MEITLAKEALEAIETMLRDISDQQVKRFASTELTPIAKGEETIGSLHSPSTQRLFVLSHTLLLRAAELKLRSQLAETEQESMELQAQASRLNGLQDVVAELKWAQAREDIGSWPDSVGIREDWMIVRRPEKEKSKKGGRSEIIASGAIDADDLPPELRKLLGID